MEAHPRVGLVLGKFAPLHKGHEYLIAFALSKVDRLYVLVYEDDGLSGVLLSKRAAWVRKLFPTVQIIEGHGSPTCTGMDEETMRIQDAYITSVMPEPVTHIFASESYVEHVARALRATPVMVDQERATYPMSATRVRDRLYELRAWVHPIVYRDLITKVVLLGAESTGKSTLTRALADHYQTTCMMEHGREFWVRHNVNGRLTGVQLEQLAYEHRAREESKLMDARRVFFTDTNAFTTLQFAHFYEEAISMNLLRMAREDMSPAARHDVRIICDTDIPFVQDGTRLTPEIRAQFQHEIVAELTRQGQPINVVSGTLDERVAQVRAILKLDTPPQPT